MENKISMKFHHYLPEVLGSAIKIKILRLLFKYPKKGFGIRELARMIDANHRSVADAVRNFNDYNLVSIRIIGRSNLIYPCPDSFLYAELLLLFQNEANSPEFLISIIKSGLPLKKIRLCVLFGSVARQKEQASSDVDLLLVSSEAQHLGPVVAQLQEKVLHLFGNVLSPLVYTPQQLKDMNPPLKESIKKEHILVHGKW